MKMEKINENQLKIELSKVDLIERNIKLAELAYGGDKARELFRELMEIALEEHEFEVNNVPIMVEAMPVSIDSVSIIVTKVTDPEDLEEKLSNLPSEDDTMDLIERITQAKKSNYFDKKIKNKKDTMIIFSFENIDIVADVSKRINTKFDGMTVLYKDNLKYFLVMESPQTSAIQNISELENILFEYGEKHLSTNECEYYLKEHGEVIIKRDAVKVLACHLN